MERDDFSFPFFNDISNEEVGLPDDDVASLTFHEHDETLASNLEDLITNKMMEMATGFGVQDYEVVTVQNVPVCASNLEREIFQVNIECSPFRSCFFFSRHDLYLVGYGAGWVDGELYAYEFDDGPRLGLPSVPGVSCRHEPSKMIIVNGATLFSKLKCVSNFRVGHSNVTELQEAIRFFIVLLPESARNKLILSHNIKAFKMRGADYTWWFRKALVETKHWNRILNWSKMSKAVYLDNVAKIPKATKITTMAELLNEITILKHISPEKLRLLRLGLRVGRGRVNRGGRGGEGGADGERNADDERRDEGDADGERRGERVVDGERGGEGVADGERGGEGVDDDGHDSDDNESGDDDGLEGGCVAVEVERVMLKSRSSVKDCTAHGLKFGTVSCYIWYSFRAISNSPDKLLSVAWSLFLQLLSYLLICCDCLDPYSALIEWYISRKIEIKTYIMDLLSSYLQVESDEGIRLAWSDGILLQGLNAILDHRVEVFIPELGRSFKCPISFRVFMCQNPSHQRGGRKGMSKSFLNRVTKVYVDELRDEDYLSICISKFPSIERSLQIKLITFNKRLHQETMIYHKFGQDSFPWEFNLHDAYRYIQGSNGNSKSSGFLNTIYIQSMRTAAYRVQVMELYEQVFEDKPFINPYPGLELTPQSLVIGDISIERYSNNLKILPGMHLCLEAAAQCIKNQWLCIFVGPSSSGKTSMIRSLAELCGKVLHELNLSSTTDISELLGSFEQYNPSHHYHIAVFQAGKYIQEYCDLDLESFPKCTGTQWIVFRSSSNDDDPWAASATTYHDNTRIRDSIPNIVHMIECLKIENHERPVPVSWSDGCRTEQSFKNIF